MFNCDMCPFKNRAVKSKVKAFANAAYQHGYSDKEILRQLKEKAGVSVTRQTLHNWRKKLSVL